MRTSSLPFRWPRLEDLVLPALLVVLALFAPAYGIAVAALVAWDRHRHGQRAVRNVAVACFALAFLSFFIQLLPVAPIGPVWPLG
ncbi:MAG: hypothetical protein ACR2OB_14775 [Solirubrobacteraceae bacterium]